MPTVQCAGSNTKTLQNLPDMHSTFTSPIMHCTLWSIPVSPASSLTDLRKEVQTRLCQTCCIKATCSASQAASPGHPPLPLSLQLSIWEVICEADLLEPLPKSSS